MADERAFDVAGRFKEPGFVSLWTAFEVWLQQQNVKVLSLTENVDTETVGA